MNQSLLFCLLLNIVIIETFQQTNQQANTPVTSDPFQQFNNAIKRNLQENQGIDINSVEYAMEDKLRKQLAIWTSIGLGFVLYFSVIAIIDMSNPKSSILYAKYDTTKSGNEL